VSRDIRVMSSYAAADQCRRSDTIQTCYRCGKCGRKFANGQLSYIPEGQTLDGEPLTAGPIDTSKEAEAWAKIADVLLPKEVDRP
jgi:hypothetical protein